MPNPFNQSDHEDAARERQRQSVPVKFTLWHSAVSHDCSFCGAEDLTCEQSACVDYDCGGDRTGVLFLACTACAKLLAKALPRSRGEGMPATGGRDSGVQVADETPQGEGL